MITLATRLPIGLADAGGWRDTTVEITAPSLDVLTGRRWGRSVALDDLLATYPVALLVPESAIQGRT
jgi:(1->4)-alpha-D-glucan 1-alpha-D-glucosylmutase